jgi:hypothetical protein
MELLCNLPQAQCGTMSKMGNTYIAFHLIPCRTRRLMAWCTYKVTAQSIPDPGPTSLVFCSRSTISIILWLPESQTRAPSLPGYQQLQDPDLVSGSITNLHRETDIDLSVAWVWCISRFDCDQRGQFNMIQNSKMPCNATWDRGWTDGWWLLILSQIIFFSSKQHLHILQAQCQHYIYIRKSRKSLICT